QVYTFQRLSVSERGVFGWQAVCNTGFYFLLWAVQCILIFAMCAMYMKTADASITSGQTVFLAFYRSKFIHCLMPLEQTGRLIRNIFTICGLGIASAYTSRAHRHDSRSFAIVVMSAGLLFFFVEINNTVNDGILIAMSIIMLIWTLTELRKEVPYEAE
ncbi:MAG: hypothetical protein IKV96_04275, partial [Firmicutes bacterium]|nr:hypothetical protein [Bacillota bacterium]